MEVGLPDIENPADFTSPVTDLPDITDNTSGIQRLKIPVPMFFKPWLVSSVFVDSKDGPT
jgi:hypothetical protein